MTFQSDLQRAVVNIKDASGKRVRRIALKAFDVINQESPVKEGTFRANWNASINALNRDFDLEKKSKDVQASVTTATAVITDGAKLGNTVFICNSVPYALKLENGYSPNKPNGVVEPSLVIIKNAIESGKL
jgi:hypothetical protein